VGLFLFILALISIFVGEKEGEKRAEEQKTDMVIGAGKELKRIVLALCIQSELCKLP